MENQCLAQNSAHGIEIEFDFGTFEGFNFRSQSAIERTLTAAEAAAWDHDGLGEAEFWPSGDHPEVSLIFGGQSSVTAAELLELNRLLAELGGASTENFLRIHYAVNIRGAALEQSTGEGLDEEHLNLFFGGNFTDLRRDAAFELFESYYPEAYAVWEKTLCDGLIFDTDRFLDSPAWSVEEIDLGDRRALIVAPQ